MIRFVKIGRRETNRRILKALRATAGLSQLAVAERLGIPEKRYWRIENGYDDIPSDLRAPLARLLKVPDEGLPAPMAQAS